ncbi:Rha family transcriptional regulator [Campylobacter coli]|uniref:Rha family transcriptional regulator n=1 Tax=Campylobacter coli TaxID=195 RepID=UPI001BFF4EC3|nr:Rha family transcriptional regulator [Campylobacter coli]HEH6094742.1 Rha family transcriptional regulator [Campylobacter jejuni]HEB7579757.1 Rha family transcriptional regulator [Campylobacter coli]HEB7582958.1 Rha family transcriptional regulator [Campylobacter coli]HEB7584809.1 Rha family transcriptional regulator [Campylobacter coli]HEB7593624.1 Rha family transcriptional regulator [Campylobacter coli]
MEKLAVINGVDVELEVVDNAVYTTSLSVAEVFNKNHKNIIRKINEFPKDNFTKLNFELSKYIDSTGRILPCYKITRDAFSLLVMGFTGEKAYKWKIEFIKAFNEMEKRLRNIEYEKHDKLAFRQSLGYKSQLAQQKQKYENEIKALKYDLEQSKNNFKDKLNCILAKNGLYAFDFKTFKNYALKLEKMLKDLKDDENKENKLLLRMQNDFLECLELYKSVNL